MINLMSIAQTEHEGGDLFGLLDDLFQPATEKPKDHPDAVVWQGGVFDGTVKPVAHALTDAFALIGTLAAIDVLGLPFYAVPMWAQYRHDTKLASLSWFGNMDCTSIKWSTAGDAYVNDGKGGKVVVMSAMIWRQRSADATARSHTKRWAARSNAWATTPVWMGRRRIRFAALQGLAHR